MWVIAVKERSGDRIEHVADSLLAALQTEQLESVVFVMDYLQLDFGRARLTMCVWPAVTVEGVRWNFDHPGYRDALCALIAQEVTDTQESSQVGLVIRFDSGSIEVNPEPSDLAGPEIAMLQVHEDAFQAAALEVWRPGEGVFADRDWS